MAAGDVRDLPQPAVRLRNHARRTLHQRLKHKRGIGISLLLLGGKFLLHLADAFPMALPVFPRVGTFRPGPVERAPVAIRRHHFVGREQQPAVSLVKQINVAKRDRANRVAMIRAGQREKFRRRLLAARSPGEFPGQLQRDFERR